MCCQDDASAIPSIIGQPSHLASNLVIFRLFSNSVQEFCKSSTAVPPPPPTPQSPLPTLQPPKTVLKSFPKSSLLLLLLHPIIGLPCPSKTVLMPQVTQERRKIIAAFCL